MNTFSRGRRTFLSLVLSVAMVLSYSAVFLGTNAEDVYADTSLITVDTDGVDENGVLHLELEEGYVQEDSWLRVFYYANVGMDPLGNYVDFKLETPEGFDCGFNSYSDSVLEEGECSGVTIWPPADLLIGEYSGITLKVYEDATGQGNFDFESDPAATFDIALDIVPRKPFNLSVWAEEINIYVLEGFEPEAGTTGSGEFDLDILNFDTAFTGESILPHIKFEFTGEDADLFYVDGLEGLTFESPETWGTTATLSVKPKQELAAGEYSADLNVYIDNTGMQVLDTPCRTIPVNLTVGERMDYDFTMTIDNYGSFAALPADYTGTDTADTAATVTIRNIGKNDITIDPSELTVAVPDGDGEYIPSDDFIIGYLKETPFVLAPGESADLATVAPAEGLDMGLHKACLNLAVECDGIEFLDSQSLEVCVLKDTASLVYQDEPLDFGALLPGFGEDQDSKYVTVINDGNVPLEITSVTKPEEGPFAEATDYGWYIPSGATAGFNVSLDAASAYAEQLGTYEGNYLVTAQECDETGEIVEGGATIQIEVPVRVEITDCLPAVFGTSCSNGPGAEPPYIFAEEGYTSSEAVTTIALMGTYGEQFYGREIGDFVKFGMDETSAALLHVEDFDPAATLPELPEEDQYYQTISLSPAEGLEPGSYQADLYLYVDPKGTGVFDEENPAETIPVSIEVYQGRAFAILLADWDEFQCILEQGYSDDEANNHATDVVIKNRSKSDLVVEKDDLKIDAGFEYGHPEAFDLSYEGIEFPVTIAPGESKIIASITPASGLDAGEYEAEISMEVGEAWDQERLILTVVKNEPSIKWDSENIDLGYLQPGFSYEEALEKSVYVRVVNNGNTSMGIKSVTVPEGSPFRVMSEYDGPICMNSGGSFIYQVMPEPYGPEASQEGVYDAVITVEAREIDENGEFIEGSEPVQAALPVHLEITEETCTITVDMQGHGENIELAGIVKGTFIDEALREVYDSFEEESPTAEGFVFGGLNGKPVSAYTSWEQYYMDDEGSLYRPLIGNTTVYAMWLTEYPGSVELTIDAPKCGTSAEGAAPQISVPEGAKYGVEDMHWLTDSDDWEEFTGEFVGGEEYLAFARVTPEFPYAFPASGPQVTINGEEYDTSQSGHGDTGNNFSLLPPAVVKAEHDLVKTEAVEPTCEDNGNIEYWTCEGCGKIFSDTGGNNEIQQADTVVEKTGHALIKTEEVPPTCTEDGTEAYWTCSKCGKLFSDGEGTSEIGKPVAIPALGHDMEKTDKVEPTCFEDGTEAYWTCSRCEKMFSDARGDKEISKPIPIAKRHTWGEWIVTKEATTSAAGEKVRECSVCHETEKQAIPKKPETKYADGWHSFGGYWYYYKNNVPVKNSWEKDSVGWCYLGSDGRMVTNGWAKDSHGWVWMSGSGYWDSGTKWISYNGGWYHITSGYRDQNKWKKDSVGWCYLGSDGRMITNGWASDSYGWCWMGADGYWTSSRWVLDHGEWYYIKSNHYMAANEWAKDGSGWMYMAANGKITKSQWLWWGGNWYYLKANGYMATGTLAIGGKTYVFDSSGKWVR